MPRLGGLVFQQRNHYILQRHRLLYLALIAAVIGLGLATRLIPGMPLFVRLYVGDALWALTVYLGLGLLFPQLQPWKAGVVALAISFAVEFSQLYQSPWINGIRRTLPGRLLLGAGFLWTDLLCYMVGVAVGVALELWWMKRCQQQRQPPGRARAGEV